MKWGRRQVLLSLGLGSAAAYAAFRWSGGAALASETILTVGGRVAGQSHRFTLSDLDALEQGTIVTKTPWYNGPRTFTGPLMRALLEHVQADGQELVVHALNDYRATIPVDDAFDFGVVLATRIDGATMSIRERGPLFVMYPFDDEPDLKTEQMYARCVWQVTRIDVL